MALSTRVKWRLALLTLGLVSTQPSISWAQAVARQGESNLASLQQGTTLRITSKSAVYYYGRYHSVQNDSLFLAEWWNGGEARGQRADALRIPLNERLARWNTNWQSLE